MAAFFPFLRLPPELRDEIYKYFVTSPPFQTPQPKKLGPYPIISLDLSIMRVNKQIHEETSRILYSQTVFPIRVKISEWQSRTLRSTHFEVRYETPWEDIFYSYAEDGSGSYRGFEDLGSKCTLVKDEDLDSYFIPSLRYRKFIRRIRIYILDRRLSLEGRRRWPISKAARDRVRKALVPFAYRLETLLADAGKEVEVQINLLPEMLQEDKEYAQNSSTTVTDGTIAAEILNLYKELIETAWPFTTGPWAYKLKLPVKIEQQYPELGAKVLRWCDEHNELTEEEKSKYRTMKTRYPYLWALKKGRLMVMEEETPGFM